MKIAFMGAQGTGKTTTMLAMGKDWKKVSNTTRAYFPDLALNTTATPGSQAIRTATNLLEISSNRDSRVVFDRSPIDPLVYTQYQSEHVWGEKPDYMYAAWESLAFTVLDELDAVFCFATANGPALIADSHRVDDLEYQIAIDKLFGVAYHMYYHQFNPVFYIVPSGTPEARAHWIESRVKELEND